MLRNSFIILEGLGITREKKLWELGIRTWDDFLRREHLAGIKSDKKKYYDRKLNEASDKFLLEDHTYFSKVLPSCEHWRLYDTFKDSCVYLDIETDGVGKNHDVTVVGLYDGFQTKSYVAGINFSERELHKELSKYKLVVSFNGSVFDIPFLQKRYPLLFSEVAHFDLRFSCKRIGFTGGLKKIEQHLGIKRSNEIVQRLHGGDAVTLFRMYRGSGDPYYLQLLLEYNEEDVVNLELISKKVVQKLTETAGFSTQLS